jgi:hypothetical protein
VCGHVGCRQSAIVAACGGELKYRRIRLRRDVRSWITVETARRFSMPSTSSEIEFEAAAFRRLLEHLRRRSDIQNIELMTHAGFCRNCLADWYREAAAASGAGIDKDAAREHIYGMPYAEWKTRYQSESTHEQRTAFAVVPKGEHD